MIDRSHAPAQPAISHRRLYSSLVADVAAAGLSRPRIDERDVTAADLAALPDVAQRYLRFMGVVGRPRDWSLCGRFEGRFRMRPGQRWMRCDAWQYTTCPEIARFFRMRLVAAHLVPMSGRDVYVHGAGEMRGSLFGLIRVADGRGPEFDAGELVTWLNDAVLFAPSMLLVANTSWSGVDDTSFDMTVTDAGTAVTARVVVDARGAPTDFITRDRWCDLPGGLVRARWSTPVDGWDMVAGRPVPGPGRAVWHLDDGPFTYVEGRLVPDSIRYNVDLGMVVPVRHDVDLGMIGPVRHDVDATTDRSAA